MTKVVLDTNVAVVANGRAHQASSLCVLACINALVDIREKRIVVLDAADEIMNEYMSHLSLSGQPGTGDAFMKWLWQNQWRTEHCEKVEIHLRSGSPGDYLEFPTDSVLDGFDRADRKFVAVSIACKERPPILNGVDRDWWDYREPLQRHGVRIDFLCANQFGDSS